MLACLVFDRDVVANATPQTPAGAHARRTDAAETMRTPLPDHLPFPDPRERKVSEDGRS